MTEKRKRRNEEIKKSYAELRSAGRSMTEALDTISDGPYGLEQETVRRIIHDKKYCMRAEKQ